MSNPGDVALEGQLDRCDPRAHSDAKAGHSVERPVTKALHVKGVFHMRWYSKLALVAAILASSALATSAETTLRFVPHSDLKILDPIWTTAFISRNHGYMVYDTLFAMDAKNEIKPQMVDTYEISADKLIYTFKLRDSLFWHDGPPVTAEDCVASIKRWSAKDSMGQKLMTLVSVLEAPDAKTVVIKL